MTHRRVERALRQRVPLGLTPRHGASPGPKRTLRGEAEHPEGTMRLTCLNLQGDVVPDLMVRYIITHLMNIVPTYPPVKSLLDPRVP